MFTICVLIIFYELSHIQKFLSQIYLSKSSLELHRLGQTYKRLSINLTYTKRTATKEEYGIYIIFLSSSYLEKERKVEREQMFDICLDASYNNHLLLIDRDVVSPPIMINYGGMLKGLHNIIQFGRRNTQFFLWRDFHHDKRCKMDFSSKI